jgi:hypothetical protein
MARLFENLGCIVPLKMTPFKKFRTSQYHSEIRVDFPQLSRVEIMRLQFVTDERPQNLRLTEHCGHRKSFLRRRYLDHRNVRSRNSAAFSDSTRHVGQ